MVSQHFGDSIFIFLLALVHFGPKSSSTHDFGRNGRLTNTRHFQVLSRWKALPPPWMSLDLLVFNTLAEDHLLLCH
jgi:hypothetical protein